MSQKPDFSIGEDLYAVSVEELKERIAVLQAEIVRLEAELVKKDADRQAANKLFGG